MVLSKHTTPILSLNSYSSVNNNNSNGKSNHFESKSIINSPTSLNSPNSTVIRKPKPKSKCSKKNKKAWYQKRISSSDYEEDSESSEDYHNNNHNNFSGLENVVNESTEKTPSPHKIKILDNREFLDYASTPLNNAVSFLSPMNKLHTLHLESEIMDDKEDDDDINDHEGSDDVESIIYEEDEEGDDEFDEYSLGNKTIANNSDENFDNNSNDEIYISPPKYINRKKRMHSDRESLDIRMSTPNTISHESKMSICHTNNSSINNSSLKLSFSTNDSTPCPPQPKRKKLKFKQASTTNILDLNYARKTSLQDIPPVPIHHGTQEDDEFEEKNDSSSFTKVNNDLDSTPISQSTPSSSRASTPPIHTTTNQENENKTSNNSNNSINVDKFVKPKQRLPPHYKYETPINGNRYETPVSGNRYNQLKQEYNKQNYHILGELPITSAGLMNEEDDDIHIGDKRINDPYLTPQNEQLQSELIKFEYFNKLRLPLLPPFFFQENLPTTTLLQLINQDSLKEFYKIVLDKEQPMIDLLKQERIKWHPDKWIGRLKSETCVTIEVIDQLSQTINSLIDTIDY